MMSTHLRAESPICTIFYRCSGGSYSTYDDDGDSDGDHTYTLRCRIPILPIGSAIVHENTRSTMISHTHTITNYVYEQARQHTILHRQTRARIRTCTRTRTRTGTGTRASTAAAAAAAAILFLYHCTVL